MNYGVTAVCGPPSNDHGRCCGFGADGTPCACACHKVGEPTPPTDRTSLLAKADEVQREMVRYCAGIDRWDQMPVVVEGWLRVFESLQAALTEPTPPTPPRLLELAADLDFAIDVTEPREVRLQRFVDILKRAGVGR